MKTFKLTITEDEMRALIDFNVRQHQIAETPSVETSERIHTLTKRLNKDTPEIEGDPRPNEPAKDIATGQIGSNAGW